MIIKARDNVAMIRGTLTNPFLIFATIAPCKLAFSLFIGYCTSSRWQYKSHEQLDSMAGETVLFKQ